VAAQTANSPLGAGPAEGAAGECGPAHQICLTEPGIGSIGTHYEPQSTRGRVFLVSLSRFGRVWVAKFTGLPWATHSHAQAAQTAKSPFGAGPEEGAPGECGPARQICLIEFGIGVRGTHSEPQSTCGSVSRESLSLFGPVRSPKSVFSATVALYSHTHVRGGQAARRGPSGGPPTPHGHRSSPQLPRDPPGGAGGRGGRPRGRGSAPEPQNRPLAAN